MFEVQFLIYMIFRYVCLSLIDFLQLADLHWGSIASGYMETGLGWNQWLFQVTKYETLISICGLYILLCFIVICLLISVVLLCLLFRSTAFSQLPGCFLFIGNIYAGSRALSLLVSTKCILKHELQCLSNVGNEHTTFVCAYVEICLSLLFF